MLSWAQDGGTWGSRSALVSCCQITSVFVLDSCLYAVSVGDDPVKGWALRASISHATQNRKSEVIVYRTFIWFFFYLSCLGERIVETFLCLYVTIKYLNLTKVKKRVLELKDFVLAYLIFLQENNLVCSRKRKWTSLVVN